MSHPQPMRVCGYKVSMVKAPARSISEPHLNPQSSNHTLPDVFHYLRKAKSLPPCRWPLAPATAAAQQHNKLPGTACSTHPTLHHNKQVTPRATAYTTALSHPQLPELVPLDRVKVQGVLLPGEVVAARGSGKIKKKVSFSTQTIIEEDEEGDVNELIKSKKDMEQYKLDEPQNGPNPVLYRLRHLRLGKRSNNRVSPHYSLENNAASKEQNQDSCSDFLKTTVEHRRSFTIKEQMDFLTEPKRSHTYVHVFNYKTPRKIKNRTKMDQCWLPKSDLIDPAPKKVPVLYQSKADQKSHAVTELLNKMVEQERLPVAEVRDTREKENFEREIVPLKPRKLPKIPNVSSQRIEIDSNPHKINVGGQKLPNRIWVVTKKTTKKKNPSKKCATPKQTITPANTPNPSSASHNVLHVYLPRAGTLLSTQSSLG